MSIVDTAAEITSFLDEQEIPYAVIGGLAVQYWGEPRTTNDIDIVVLLAPDKIESFFDAVIDKYRPRLKDAVAFAKTNRVLLVSGADGTPVDISMGIPGYEEEVIRRAVVVTLPNERTIRLISPEDLIIHKCIAGRPRDLEDIERILVRQKLTVDTDYIKQWLNEFAALVENREIVDVFENALERVSTDLV